MAEVGAEANPLRFAIIGSGPAGFSTVSNFSSRKVFRLNSTCMIACQVLLVSYVLASHRIIKRTNQSFDPMAKAQKIVIYAFQGKIS